MSVDISKCETCEKDCPQAKARIEAATGRMYAMLELAKCVPYWEAIFDESEQPKITPDRLLELIQADRDGRCVMLRCKVGDTIYVVGGKVVKAKIEEIYLMDDGKGVEYLVDFNCNEVCDGCPFYAWEQSWEGEWNCDCEYGNASVYQKDFGKTWFLDEDAAKAALKGERHE